MSPDELLNECYAYSDYADFTDWEREFIDSLEEGRNRYGSNFRLTERQLETLTKIYEQRVIPLL